MDSELKALKRKASRLLEIMFVLSGFLVGWATKDVLWGIAAFGVLNAIYASLLVANLHR